MADQMAATPRQAAERHLVVRASEDEAFRALLLSDPKVALKQELGVEMPAAVRFHVIQESPSDLYMVLPLKPAALRHAITGDELSDAELDSVSGGGDIDGCYTWGF
jgi:hypothetical protein